MPIIKLLNLTPHVERSKEKRWRHLTQVIPGSPAHAHPRVIYTPELTSSESAASAVSLLERLKAPPWSEQHRA